MKMTIESAKEFLELINGFKKAIGHKVNTQISYFCILAMNNKKLQFKNDIIYNST